MNQNHQGGRVGVAPGVPPGVRRGAGGWPPGVLPLVLGLSLAGCSSLLPKPAPQPAAFSLQGVPVTPALPGPSAPLLNAASKAPVLVVHVPSAAPGFESARIIYTRQPQRLEYFAQSEWVDSPARMLAPFMVSVLDRSGSFRGVVLAPSAALGDLHLDTHMLRLQQEFGPARSQVRLSFRAQLIDNRSHLVLATRDFESTAASASEDAVGGVAAAQQVMQTVLLDLSHWCRDVVAASRQPPPR